MNNNKRISIVLSVSLLLLGIIGCSKQTTSTSIPTTVTEQTQNKIPEPYTLMLKQLDSGDLDMAQKYADLVISDFKNSDYVYNAELVKNIIISSKLTVDTKKWNYLSDGISQMGTLNTKEDIKNVKKYVSDLDTEMKSYNPIFTETTKYILDHYSDVNKVKLELPTKPNTLTPPSNEDFHALSWFSSVGTPIPKEVDIKANDKENIQKAFYFLINGYSAKPDFSYVNYFDNTSKKTEDIALRKELLNKVIQLTENDKYNKTRLQAQDELNKIK